MSNKPYIGSCAEFLTDEEYLLRQRSKEIVETNYEDELSKKDFEEEDREDG